MWAPCLSDPVAGRALTPATRHSLGKPLPYQQADRTQAPLSAGSYALSQVNLANAVLPHFSAGYSTPKGRFLRVTHPSAAIHPKVNRSTCIPKARR
jgi:hypothetical protein